MKIYIISNEESSYCPDAYIDDDGGAVGEETSSQEFLFAYDSYETAVKKCYELYYGRDRDDFYHKDDYKLYEIDTDSHCEEGELTKKEVDYVKVFEDWWRDGKVVHPRYGEHGNIKL